MEQILIEVYIPAAGKFYGVWVPESLWICELTEFVAKMLNELSDGSYMLAQTVLLCDHKSGKPFDPNVNVRLSGLENGSKVMMV